MANLLQRWQHNVATLGTSQLGTAIAHEQLAASLRCYSDDPLTCSLVPMRCARAPTVPEVKMLSRKTVGSFLYRSATSLGCHRAREYGVV